MLMVYCRVPGFKDTMVQGNLELKVENVKLKLEMKNLIYDL